jgi:hypothetical protein
VPFTDFLKTAVLLFGGAATALAVVSIAGATRDDDVTLIYIALAWWSIAAIVGAWLGRPAAVSAGISRLLAMARTTSTLPEIGPGRIVVNRLWPLAAITVVSGGLAFLLPQAATAATGYALIAALAWRKQADAVLAVEKRDGVRFYVEDTSPFRGMSLLRTPGIRQVEPVPDAEEAGRAG